MSVAKRRLPIVPGFQAQFVMTLMVWLAVWLLAFAVLLVGPLVWELAVGSPTADDADTATALLLMHGRLWLPLIALFLGLALLIVRMTHRVAGPLYRFRQVFGQIAGGDLSMRVQIRSGDYLDGECDDLNVMVGSLRDRVHRARTATAALRRDLRALSDSAAPVDPARVATLLARAADADDALATFTTERATPGARAESAATSAAPARRATSDAGFSLVELLIVLCVVSALAAMAVPAYQSALDRARVARAIGDINAIGKDVAMFRVASGCFPGTLTAIGRSTLRDPWKQPYSYAVPQRPGGKGRGASAGSCGACGGACVGTGQARKDKNLVPINNDFDLFSSGKDRKSSTALTAKPSQDDIIRGRNGGFIGLVKDY